MFDILIWAHSDQAGGTEIPCVLLKALKEFFGTGLEVGILTPFPQRVEMFFKEQLIKVDEQDIIITEKFLALETAGGLVDTKKTHQRLLEYPFNNLDRAIETERKKIENRIHDKTLMISCGEPIAIKVAKDLGINSVIVTDHLLTCTVRWVLVHGGLFDKQIAGLLTAFESYDRLANEAFLSPLEFASHEYEEYLSHGRVHCTSIGGLFYEPPEIARLRELPPYKNLLRIVGSWPIVFVFGGGGAVWLQLYSQLHLEAQSQGAINDFALLVPDVEQTEDGLERRKDGKIFLYKLYLPEGVIHELRDPGSLMNWYAACALVVGRGGLAAQQVLATMMSDLERAPQMLFVEEPGHPQIEHERLSLYNLEFVYSRTHSDLTSDPLGVIKKTLETIALAGHPRQRVKVRYGKGMMKELARYLIDTYRPFPVSADDPEVK